VAESTQQVSLYGAADAKGTSRFQILGDQRRMYPIFVAGSVYDSGFPPHHIARGASNQLKNMIVRGDSLYAIGGKNTGVTGAPGTLSLRLGTASNAGTDALVTAGFELYGFPFGVRRLDAGIHCGLMVNGEAFYRDTQPTVPQLGCAAETFTIAGTINQVTVGSQTVTGTGSNFASATLPGYAYTPSLNIPRTGDIIRIVQGGNNYYHRITAIASDTSLTIYPAWGKQLDNTTSNGATSAGPGAGLTYAINRTGYGSYSRIVSIYNSSDTKFYNYYAGNHFSTALPGTIECFTREASGSAASSHFMGPKGVGGTAVTAQDIVYYKSFLLWGYGQTVWWSGAGFPLTFPFDTNDLNYTNGVTVVDNQDQFVSFELLGDQLLAIFRSSIWEIQATGTTGEFQFYRLPEPVGASLPPASDPYGSAGLVHARPTTTARGEIYYISHAGVMSLSGRTATKVSDNVHGLISSYLSVPAALSWDSSADILMVTGLGGKTGYTYRTTEQTWATFDISNMSGSIPARYLGSVYESGNGLDLVAFKDGAGLISLDNTNGSPFSGGAPGNPDWTYQSPVVSMGDDYSDYPFAGFQLDGRFSTGITYSIYGASNPIDAAGLVNLRDTGTLGASTGQGASNRKLYGKKVDDPFICIVLTAPNGINAQLTAINIYTLGMGK
jgi:hypothetical protein